MRRAGLASRRGPFSCSGLSRIPRLALAQLRGIFGQRGTSNSSEMSPGFGGPRGNGAMPMQGPIPFLGGMERQGQGRRFQREFDAPNGPRRPFNNANPSVSTPASRIRLLTAIGITRTAGPMTAAPGPARIRASRLRMRSGRSGRRMATGIIPTAGPTQPPPSPSRMRASRTRRRTATGTIPDGRPYTARPAGRECGPAVSGRGRQLVLPGRPALHGRQRPAGRECGPAVSGRGRQLVLSRTAGPTPPPPPPSPPRRPRPPRRPLRPRPSRDGHAGRERHPRPGASRRSRE